MGQGTDADDEDLQVAVTRALAADLLVRIPDIAVEVTGGVVTLRGTAADERASSAATADAGSVYGVRSVRNLIDVAAGVADTDDAVLRATVLQALMADGSVPDTVDVRIASGRATLSGSVQDAAQAERAAAVTGRILGVRSVTNELTVRA